jgi:hypothetical protein
MIRLIVPFINLLIILTFQMFPGNISVKMDVPAQVSAGSEFEVRITLNKSNLEGFSRFQQNIPAGLTATSGMSSNADFSFSEKRVRLIWLRVPRNDEVMVSYKIKVDEKLKGTFSLSGKFSYIENNDRKSIDIDPVSVTILPSPSVDPSLIVDINDYDKMAAPYSNPAPENAVRIACIRQRPYQGTTGEYIVNLLVNKQTTQNFAKIEEDVPEGYTAVALDTKDAIFTFKSQKVKFLWMNLPVEPYFTVAYRLIPKNRAKLPPPSIKGAFSYLDEEKTISISVLERDIQLASLSENDVKELVTQVLTEPAPEVVRPTEQVNEAFQTAQKETVSANNTKTVQPAKQRRQPREKPVKSENSVLLEPEQGVYYRIQLAAGHKPVNIERYFRKLKVEKEVRKEEHDGWQKYSIGSFNVYMEARDYRIHIWNTTPVKDAFVTAYNSGKRITVQEALMVTEQQWYR